MVLTAEEHRSITVAGKGFRPLQTFRRRLPALRSLKICWFCDNPAVNFANERTEFNLPHTVCSTHRLIARSNPDRWQVFCGAGYFKTTLVDWTRWNLATKNNPFGYMHSLTTPEQYKEWKDYYKRLTEQGLLKLFHLQEEMKPLLKETTKEWARRVLAEAP